MKLIEVDQLLGKIEQLEKRVAELENNPKHIHSHYHASASLPISGPAPFCSYTIHNGFDLSDYNKRKRHESFMSMYCPV